MKLICYIFFILTGFHSVAQDKSIRIDGRVTSDRGNYGVENAEVHLKLSGGYSFSYKTDSSGMYHFSFGMSTPSSCTLSVSVNKYSKSVYVRDGCFLKSKETGIISELHDSVNYVKDFIIQSAFCEYEYPPIFFTVNSIVSCNDSLHRINSARYVTFDSILNRFYKTLTDNPTIVLEFLGHASTLENKHAEAIALYRAQLMCELLIAKGIDRKRLMARGFGNRKLLITDLQIKKAQNAEEKRTLHLKNQRVTFRILSWDYVEKEEEEEVPDIDGK